MRMRPRGRASACHAEGRGFDSRHPLEVTSGLVACFAGCYRKRMDGNTGRHELAAMAKIVFLLVIPVLALYPTLRVGGTALGLDQVTWRQWPEVFFGVAGVNLAIPLFLVLLLGRLVGAVPMWDFIRSAPREIVAIARKADGARPLSGLAFLLGATVLPVVAVWLFPEAWTHWSIWLVAGIIPSLPAVWWRLFHEEPRRVGVMGAVATLAACTLTTFVLHDQHAQAAPMLWAVPLASVAIPFVTGRIVGELPRHIHETRKARDGQRPA